MSRYVLYLAVALFAFGIGLFFVFSDIEHVHKISVVRTKSEEFKTPTEKTFGYGNENADSADISQTNQLTADNQKPEITCTNKKLLPLWNELKKDDVFQESAKSYSMDCEETLDVQNIDLNGDGQKEILLWGKNFFLCGGTGNCALWIYEKKNDKYRQLLQSYAYNGETKWFEVKKGKTKGFRNLLLKGHFTAAETTHSFYKFNGRKYIENKCLFEIYFMNKEKPSFMTCNEYYKASENQ